MGIIWPNREFPVNPQRIMKETTSGSAAKNRDSPTIVNRHTSFFLALVKMAIFALKII